MSNFRYLTNGKNNNIVLVVCKDYDTLSMKAAQIIAAQVNQKPDCILGLATGSSPVGLYKKLIEMYENGEIDFKDVKSYNLDEYYPITPDNDHSYRYFMDRHLFDRVNINKANTYVPDGTAADPDAFCREYDAEIKAAGGIGIQLLGVGQNGHIGFNEPADKLIGGTHLTALTESTIDANSRFFASRDDVPRHAITMGIDNILDAAGVVLVASGKNKHNALMALINAPEDPHVPVTMLRRHKNLMVFCDEDAYRG